MNDIVGAVVHSRTKIGRLVPATFEAIFDALNTTR